MKILKMKSILFSLLAIMAVAVFLTSCEENFIIDDDVEGLGLVAAHDVNGTIESVDDELAALPEREVTVEHATLDEINEVMIENGLKPFTEEDIEIVQSRGNTYTCNAWRVRGDWNGDGILSTWDLAQANQYLVDNGGWFVSIPTTGHPFHVRLFGELSYMSPTYGNSRYSLNQNDIRTAREVILGIITCI